MQKFTTSLLLSTTLAALLAACGGGNASQPMPNKLLSSTVRSDEPLPPYRPTYDDLIRAALPVLYLGMSTPGTGAELDLTGRGHNGVYRNKANTPASLPTSSLLPNGDPVAVFDGTTQFLRVADHDDLSIPTTKILTLEAWIRPDVLEFPSVEGSGYVHWMGKGIEYGADNGDQEYTARMYSYTNTENRPNRISGYGYNLVGGPGNGSYSQLPVTAGQWIHYVLVINTTDAAKAQYPAGGYVRIYRDGKLEQTRPLDGYVGDTYVEVRPGNGVAPFQVGSRDGIHSFFKGAIGKVAIYNRELDATTIANHNNAMRNSAYLPCEPTCTQ